MDDMVREYPISEPRLVGGGGTYQFCDAVLQGYAEGSALDVRRLAEHLAKPRRFALPPPWRREKRCI